MTSLSQSTRTHGLESGSGAAGTPPSDAGAAVTVITPGLRTWQAAFGSLWPRRELVFFLAYREIRARYHEAVLGSLWALLQPLLVTVVYALVFGLLVKIPSEGVPYPVFVMAGVLPWQFIAQSIQRSSLSLISNNPLIKKVYFPRAALPLAAVTTALVDFALSALCLAGLMMYYGVMPTGSLALLPVVLLLTMAMTTGIGLVLASLNCRVRDVAHGISFLMQMWMFLTPVLYPLSFVPARYVPLVRCNPMTGLIVGYRAALLGSPIDVPALVVSGLCAMAALAAGALVFRRAERVAADVL